ncbi:hypothetical protein EUTSA_v10027258mg [Eutrema salsugineum]|uniref:DOG1 domain-containing protein n=1 Tax=Eutrema salsugineum TaxID=72664 RepID=V4MQW1_EUTSA|nr:protein DOG1-like 3 [Eutrema salsugineum]ESQ55523.1 hypothetical protein EUTSA_v10027258mg [Eutrema salsugineum]
MATSNGIEQLQKGCYHEWMSLQAKRIVDLKEALTTKDDRKLGELVGEIVDEFQKYTKKRSELSDRSCSSYFAPSWNSSLENSLLWMGGCRPSSFIRVIYATCGSQAETQLSQYLLKIDENIHENHGDGSLSDLTSVQLGQINELHMKVIEKEDKLSKKAANLQEDVADMPIAVTAYATDLVEAGVAVENVLDKHEECLGVLMAEADKLRVETLKKIVEVMTPVQAAEFLLAGKRLHVSLHEWGRVREERRFGCAHVDHAAAARS